MKKYIISLIMTVVTVAMSYASVPDNESINYRVMYKWGLVNKQAGTVNLSTHRAAPNTVDATLTARSEKWADAIYSVRDTLRGRMNIFTTEPSFYEKITHEGGEYKHDLINYTRNGDNVTATCHRTKQKSEKKPREESEITLQAKGLTLDMLSAFYYMRSLDYPKMKAGDKKTLTVFSGKRKETLTITYQGKEDVKIDKTTYPAYKISFSFTGEGGKKTSDSMFAWISTVNNRIPLKLVGKLPVGSVQCYYIK